MEDDNNTKTRGRPPKDKPADVSPGSADAGQAPDLSGPAAVQAVQMTTEQLKELVVSIVEGVLKKNIETIPDGEQTRVRTVDEASALLASKNINWQDPEKFYMQVEKLPSQITEELGDRILLLKDRGFEVEVETSRFVIVSLPRSEYNRRIKENQDLSTQKRRSRVAPHGLIADPIGKVEEEINLHDLFKDSMTERMIMEAEKEQGN